MSKSRLPVTVIVLGLTSFFTDFSSEMIYPLLPVFLTTILGASAVAIGIIEGIAEASASTLKIISGYWTDKLPRRKPLIVAGYALASVVRPLIGLANGWPLVLFFRFTDRIGKGIRTSPRDSLIADVVAPERRGEAYGFHRAMDHAGAVVGPLAAVLLMGSFGLPIRTVFLFAAIPAVVVIVLLVFGLKEQPRQILADSPHPGTKAVKVPFAPGFLPFLVAVGIFTLGNSTDAFLLLRMTEAGVEPVWIAALWAAHHVVKMVSTYFGGTYSDNFGYRGMIIAGWIVYAMIYLGFGMVENEVGLISLFLAYGLYFGLTEPAEKALVSRLARAETRGRGFGWYHGVIGLGALPASIVFGLLYKEFGPAAAFGTGAALAITAAIMLSTIRIKIDAHTTLQHTS